MTITWGKIHKYFGMTIYYSLLGKLKLSMVDYIGKVINYILGDMKVESATPAAHHLFDIAENITKPSQTDAELFHHFVTQLLYLSKQAPPYI